MKLTPSRASLAVLLLPLILAAPAAADLVTVAVTGNVTRSDFATIGVDSLVTGQYTYDDAMADLDSHPSKALYGPVVFSLSFADDSTISSDAADILVNNDSSGHGTVDEYSVRFPSSDLVPVPPNPNTLTGSFEDMWLYSGRLHRCDRTGVAWDSDALPDPESVLSLLPDDQSLLILLGGSGPLPTEYMLFFEVIDLSIIPTVPAPGALLLGTIGLACAGWLRRRKAS